MSTETQLVTPATGQSQTETITEDKVLARLSEEFGETVKTVETPKTDPVTPDPNNPPVELTAEEKTELINKAKELGLPETATKEEIEIAEKAKLDENTWKLDEVIPTKEEETDGSWKGIAEAFELGDIPEDYSEEKGFEIVQDLFNKKLEAVKAEAITEAKFERFVDVPEAVRGEAELVVELMKAGQTLQQINEPFIELAQFKAMSKEELVRSALMARYANDEEVVTAKMEALTADNKLDIEYKLAKADLDNYEQSLNAQRQQQVKNYQNNQKQIQEQRFNQETAKLKHALGGVQEYLGKKLTPEVKAGLEKDLASGIYHSMQGTPEEKIDYLLYRRFGKAGIKSLQARALEEATLKTKQQLHNVPIKTNSAGNRVEITDQTKTEVDRRLEQEFGAL